MAPSEVRSTVAPTLSIRVLDFSQDALRMGVVFGRLARSQRKSGRES